jgi:hypothetical protein
MYEPVPRLADAASLGAPQQYVAVVAVRGDLVGVADPAEQSADDGRVVDQLARPGRNKTTRSRGACGSSCA